MKAELISIKDHTTNESQRSEASVKRHVSGEVTTAERAITAHITREIVEKVAQVAIESNTQASTKEQQDRLLQSLHYPAMYERMNDLTDSYKGTFRWIFADDNSSISNIRSSNFWSSNFWSSNKWSYNSLSSNNWPPNNWPSNNWSSNYLEDNRNNLEDKPWDNFNDWLKSESKIYWISGKPGSGKSTLMKYLIESPSTKAGLEIWNTSPVILSHFFWKPGSRMQNSMKGFLCSILHQFFRFSTPALDSILATSESLLLKESVTDWSMKELKGVSLSVLESYPLPLCIFVDGLDEICDANGPRPILNLVDDLQLIPNVKICVASRPETLLQSALSRHQHLRLQDFTKNDMRKYSTAEIQPYIGTHRISPDFGSDTIVDTLIDKAEGVFLWLQLAIRNLIRGIENGDTDDELEQRLQDLPNELSNLYSDMWARMNEDSKIYRETAARYFNLLIASETLSGERGIVADYTSLFHIMAATETHVQDAFINERAIMDTETLERLCRKVQHAIQVRCAGLLEIAQHQSERISTRMWTPTYERILPYRTATVQFIHRTAYDFIANTEEGRRIRSHDTSDQGALYIQLIKGELVFTKVVLDRSSQDVQSILNYLSRAIVLSSRTAVHQLLRIAWDWYDDGCYGIHGPVLDGPIIKFRPNFLTYAANYPGLHSFIMSTIAESPSPATLAAEISRNINYHECTTSLENYSNTINFVKSLLYLSNSTRSKGIYYGASDIRPLAFLTPLGSLMQQVFRNMDTFLSKDISLLGKLLLIFIEADPDLDERIPLLINLHKSIPLVGSMAYDEEIAEGFDLSIYRHDEYLQECVVLDSTVGFLIKALCENLCRPGTLQHPISFPFEELKMRIGSWNGSNSPPPRIKLVIVYKGECFGPPRGRRFRPTTEVATEALLSSALQFLSGDESKALDRKMRREFTNIRREICNKSAKFEEVHKTAKEILAEEGCGYCFVDENGDPIARESNSDDDTNHCSNNGSPFEDHFYYKEYEDPSEFDSSSDDGDGPR